VPCVYIYTHTHTECVNSIWGNIGNDQHTLFPAALCLCVYQEVESSHFGLVMFTEGQSGLAPANSRPSQPNLGKYAIHACAWKHTKTHTLGNTDTRAHPHTHTHTHTHTQSKTHNAFDANKQTNMSPGFLFLSLFVFFSVTQRHTHTHTQTLASPQKILVCPG